MVATLKPGTAASLAARLRQLVAYGAAYRPPADSVLADTIDGAVRMAAYLEDLGGKNTLGPDDGAFASADGLAAQIVDEVMSGAYGPPKPPPDDSSGKVPTLVLVLGGLGALGVVFALAGSRR